MIRNIVFDMGGVLVDYEADLVCRHFIKDEALREKIQTDVFVSPEWVMLDMGVISEEEGLRRMQARLSSEEEKRLAAECFLHWHEYNMWPVEGMKEEIEKLKDRGFGVYLCSNASVRLLTCYKEIIPGIRLFDGILFSAEEKCIKPQKEIYERLFEKFRLKPEECFFIDDVQLNIDGAAACGMKGCCHDGDVKNLKALLDSFPSPGSAAGQDEAG